ncbi:MAG: hypothetical protein WCT41_00945 [Candidatus Paceibacterota bacterium]
MAARGIKAIRFVKKEETTKSITPWRDKEAIAKKKANRLKESRRREAKESRERRKQAKTEKTGMKNLRHQGLIH